MLHLYFEVVLQPADGQTNKDKLLSNSMILNDTQTFMLVSICCCRKTFSVIFTTTIKHHFVPSQSSVLHKFANIAKVKIRVRMFNFKTFDLFCNALSSFLSTVFS